METCTCLRGTVVKDGTAEPMAGVTVRLSQRAGRGGASLSETTTDEAGRFSFNLDNLRRRPSGAEYHLAVYDGVARLPAHGDVRWPVGADGHDLVLCVVSVSACAAPPDPTPIGLDPDEVVFGRVLHADGSPVADLSMVLVEVGFTGEAPSGSPVTSAADGWFNFGSRSPTGPIDLYVKAFVPGSGGADPRLVGVTPVHYGFAGGGLRLDVRVCDDSLRGPSEFHRLSAALANAVAVAASPPWTALDTALASASIQQVAWLCGKTGEVLERITMRAVSARLAATLNGTSPTVPVAAEALYGLLRMGFPSSIGGLLVKPASKVVSALSRARTRNIIGLDVDTDTVLSSLEEGLGRVLLETGGAGMSALGDLLDASAGQTYALGSTRIAAFCKLYAEHRSSNTAFWTALAAEPGFKDGDEDYLVEARRLVRLGTIGLGNADVVKAILGKLGEDEASDVSGWTLAEWHDDVVSDLADLQLPQGLDGVVSEQRDQLSRLLFENAQRAWPSTALGSRLRDGTAGSAGVELGVYDVLSANPSLDLRTHVLASGSFTPSSAGETADLLVLRKAQRLYRIAPAVGSTDAMVRLHTLGLTSARDVVRMGRTRFAQKYAALGTGLEEEATEIVRKSQSQTAMATAFFLAAHPALGQATLGFVGQTTPTVSDSDFAGYSTLFTSTGGTRCRWCQSVHGPGAYLVDLLHWLTTKTPEDGSTSSYTDALAVLTDRRPDLTALPLTCANAERALPYIDLVLEILEAAARGVTLTAESSDAQTPEMLASPQWTDSAAYASGALGDGARAFQVPFHQPLHEARAFLAHLGIDRTDLMRAFPEGAWDLDDIGQEEIGLSTEGAAAITTDSADLADELATYWMLDAASFSPTVRELRRATGLSFESIQDLLHVRLANPPVDTADHLSVLLTGTNPYDLDSYQVRRVTSISPVTYGDLDQSAFSRVRKVLRLRNATGWSFLELDKVAYALKSGSPGTWTESTLTDLADVHRLARLVDVPPTELAAWFDLIDTYEDRATAEHPVLSLYDRTFLSRSLFPLTEQETSFPFALSPTRDEVADTSLVLADHLARLHAVLGFDEGEIAALIDALDAVDALVVASGAPVVTLGNLSRLYRWCSFARVFGLKPTDALRLATLLGEGPWFDTGVIHEGFFADPEGVLDVVQRVHRLQAGGWSVDELDYLLRHRNPERVGPTDAWLQGLLGRLRDQRRTQTDLGTDEARDAVLRQLSAELGVERACLDALDTTMWAGGRTADEAAPFPLFVATEIVVAGASGLSTTGATTVTLTASAGTIASGTTITVPSGVLLGGISLGPTLPVATPCRFTSSGIEFAQAETTGTAVTVPSGTTVDVPSIGAVTLTSDASGTLAANTSLLSDAVSEGAISGIHLFDRFQRAAFLAADASGANPWANITRDDLEYGADLAVLDAVVKALFLQRKVGADDDERAAWAALAADWGLLAPSVLLGASLEGRAADSLSADFTTRLEALNDLFLQRARVPGTTPSFADLLGAADAAGFVEDLAARTGWDATALAELNPSLPGSSGALREMLDRWELVKRTGVAVDVIQGWAAPGSLAGFTSEESREIVAAARSRYGSADAWATVARPIRDRVRKAQRDALVSYLLAETGLDDADQLYERYLIDVSMNPEMLTSRIVQAACSVQLFVHRCLFGLETDPDDVSLSAWFNDDDRLEWDWMRTYRTWEAARKVFLYPENWIEPELRDDKTPFFLQLEQELAQGDVTEDRAEQVLLDYLDRLHEVSSLQVLAYYVQQESDADGEIDVLHVFARSHSDPPTYWYRRREDGATWTAWEKIEAGVQGSHLLPVVWNRRLMLFWAEFTETNGEAAEDDPQTQPSPASWWEIRLSMSSYRDGKWSPKQTGTTTLSLQSALPHHKQDVSTYGFVATVGEPLTISCLWTGLGATGERVSVELCTFTLDGCRMDLAVELASGVAFTRIGLDSGVWTNPGWDTSGDDNLTVYAGPWDDATGEATGTASALSVLGTLANGIGVVGGQWLDFVSQAPFFVSVDDRSYFVEPSVSPTDDLAAETGSETPSLSALASFRAGTSPAAGEGASEPPDVTALSGFLPSGSFSSGAAGIDALRSSASSLAGTDTSSPLTDTLATYHFSVFHHPYVCRFIKEVRRNGALGLLDPDPNGTAADLFRQALTEDEADSFSVLYTPTDRVDTAYPVDDIDFSLGGAYAQYNWEIFFHLPFYLASRLADAGRYDEAFPYLHAVFDPRTRADVTSIEGAVANAQWWKVKPFLGDVSAPVTDWVAFSTSEDTDSQASFERQVAEWRADPFNPHLLARLRPGTYQRAFVMRYVDTLLAWGDQLFTKDTLESINEATQLYVFARQVLGDRPEVIGETAEPTPQSYDDLAASLDVFSNALVAVENAGFAASGYGGSTSTAGGGASLGYTPFFCVPFNARLLSYWDTVEDRLFKIRNGMNIEGVVRSLPLFQPPIDPAMLVRAAAAGVDIGSVTSTASVGNYRFSVMLGRAQALAGSVKALGQSLLSALEKRDAEGLALLRQGHEAALFASMKAVREQQVSEAEANRAALRKTKQMTQHRHDYYERLISKGWLPNERKAARLTESAVRLDEQMAIMAAINAILSWIPDTAIGVALHARTGGSNANDSLSAVSAVFGATSNAMKVQAGYLTTTASYHRRAEEWKHQKRVAAQELAQIDKQLEAASLRVEIARRELSNQELQIRHSGEVTEWMESKFTNRALYDWHASQLSALYFQAWQLALATARKAEACYQRELASEDTFIGAAYWDSTRKGLLAGEKLAADLERMDLAYLDADTREHEMTRNISLARLDPLALARLRADGECYFVVPEALFDLDCPNHYRRRLQSAAVSIAAVTGAQGNVNARLTLHSASIRDELGVSADDGRSSELPSIVTSSATQDSGLFQLDLKDPRYLPFEKRGAAGHWHLALTATTIHQFDWESITDVTLHLRYSAKYGDTAATIALTDLAFGYADASFSSAASSGGPVFLLSAKRDDPDGLFAAQEADATSMDFEVTEGMLGTLASLEVRSIVLIPVLSGTSGPSGYTLNGSAMTSGSAGVPFYYATPSPDTAAGTYTIGLSSMNFDALDDLLLVLVMKSADV